MNAPDVIDARKRFRRAFQARRRTRTPTELRAEVLALIVDEEKRGFVETFDVDELLYILEVMDNSRYVIEEAHRRGVPPDFLPELQEQLIRDGELEEPKLPDGGAA